MMMTTMMIVALKGAAVLALAGVASLLLGRASASLRHLVWTAGLTAVLVLPALEAADLRIEIPVPRWLAQERPSALPAPPAPTAAPERVPAPAAAPSVPESLLRPASSPAPVTAPRAPRPVREPGAEAERAPVAPSRATEQRRTTVAATSEPADETEWVAAAAVPATPPMDGGALPWVALLAGVWLLGALSLLTVTLRGQRAARRLVTAGVWAAPRAAVRRMTELCGELGIGTPVRLVVRDRLDVPATWGLLSSTIVLPRSHAGWSPETLDRVLLHELAHIARRDCWTRLVGEVARALYWPNPLAWVAVARQRVESERACDDRVLDRGDQPSAYAEDLVVLARALGRRRIPAAAFAMAGRSAVPGRVRAILDPLRPRGRVGRGGAATAAAATCALALALTALVPVAAAQEAPAAPDAIESPAPVHMVEAIPEPAPEPWPEPGAEHALEPIHETVWSPGHAPPGEPHADSDHEPWSATAVAQVAPSPRSPAFDRSWIALAGRAFEVPALRLSGSGQSQELCVFLEDERRSTSYHTDDDVTRIRWETDSCRVEIDLEGRVDFSADDTDIVSMADGALFEIEERIGRTSRRARYEGEGGGRIERSYWVDGDRQEWGSDAERWIARILPELFRHTTINAEARVRRMLRDGGAERVFEEVARIRSDHVGTHYMRLLMGLADLTDAQYTRIVEYAAEIESDHNSAELLLSVVDAAGLLPAFQEPMLRAAERLESDHQQTRVLQALLDSPLSSDQIDAVLRATRSIDSDHSLGQVLTTVARKGDLSTAGRAAYMDALRSIESDHQYAMVLDAFLDEGRLTSEELSQVLAMSSELESDHQLATVLQDVARDYPLTGSQLSAYLRAASSIESDHQMAVTATTIIDRAEFSAEQAALVLDMTDEIESDHQRATVLTALIERRDLSDAEIDDFIAVAARIDSDHQLGQVLIALARDEPLNDRAVLAVLDAAGYIDSDHQLAGVLVELARHFEIDGRVRDRYEALAEGLSRHQRSQVLDAIRR